ncbi:MAG: DUF3667 domain-containing protein [Aquaticitalea sp.]
MSKALMECSNCAQRFEAHYPYCPYCGQQAENKLTLGVLFSNTISNYFSVDARFFKSYLPLMTKPGFLAKEFVDGKRILYLHPAQMYLFISVVFFFLLSFISREQTQSIDSAMKGDNITNNIGLDSIHQRRADSIATERFLNPLRKNQKQLGLKDEEISQVDSILHENSGPKGTIFGIDFNGAVIDSMIASGTSDQKIYEHLGMKEEDGFFKKRIYKQGLKFYKAKNGGDILQAFYDSIPIAMFILLPIFGLILKLFYFNKGPFAYHLVFTFYFFSFLFTVGSLLVLSTLLWKNFPVWVILIIMFSTFFYLFLSVKRFYKQGYFLSFIKSSMVAFLYLSFVLPFAAIIMGLVAFLFY